MASKADVTQLKYPIPTEPAPNRFPLQSPRGARMAGRVWDPQQQQPLRALCLFVHGGGWHSGYFEELAQGLCSQGIFCAAYDQPGCGYSDNEPGVKDGVTHVDGFDSLVEDAYAAVDWMKKEADVANDSDVPCFLFGESFGGLIVMGAAYQQDFYNTRIDGVVVSGGLLKLSDKFLPPRPVVSALVFLAKYYPKIVMPATDFESTFDDAFGDKDWAKTARADPCVTMAIRATVGGVATTLRAGTVIRAKAKEFPVPLFAAHGKGDVRTSCEAMEEFIDKLGPTGSMKVLDTDGHQLLQDTSEIRGEMINEIKIWLGRMIGK